VTASISWLTAQINAAISSLFGVQTQYIRVDGKTIHHGFMIPESMAAELSQQGLALPAIGTVIALVAIALALGLLLIIVFMFVPGGADMINKILRAVPGMLVMVVGGVATSVLPSFAKVAGLVPLGIGGYLVFEAFVGSPSSPTPPNGNGGNGDEIIGIKGVEVL